MSKRDPTRGHRHMPDSKCPCCHQLTLSERGAFEVCPACFWEDDGQDDHDADVVRGGPNGSLSLTQARANFLSFGACDRCHLASVRRPWNGRSTPIALRVARECIWAVALAVVSVLIAWAYFGFDWPTEPTWTFYAPYSLYTELPWLVAAELFVVLAGLRAFVVVRAAALESRWRSHDGR